MKRLAIIFFHILAAVLSPVGQASAQCFGCPTVAWDVAGHGTPVDSALPATTVQDGFSTAVGLNTLSRVGVTGVAAGNSFNSTGWNNTSTFNQNSQYITFTLQPSVLGVLVANLGFAINGSNTAPNTGRWGYSVDGGAFVLFPDFTIFNPQLSSLAVFNFAPVFVAPGQNVEFRFWASGNIAINGGSASSSGTVRIANIAGNDLILNVPEPSAIVLIATGMAGLLAFLSRRYV
jgi:hypothetical protein